MGKRIVCTSTPSSTSWCIFCWCCCCCLLTFLVHACRNDQKCSYAWVCAVCAVPYRCVGWLPLLSILFYSIFHLFFRVCVSLSFISFLFVGTVYVCLTLYSRQFQHVLREDIMQQYNKYYKIWEGRLSCCQNGSKSPDFMTLDRIKWFSEWANATWMMARGNTPNNVCVCVCVRGARVACVYFYNDDDGAHLGVTGATCSASDGGWKKWHTNTK